MKTKTFALAVSTLALVGAATFVQPALAQNATTNVTTRDGRGADAMIQGGEFATKNYGTTVLLVKNTPEANFMRKIYLRFDLAGVANPLANLDTATLQLAFAAPVGASPEDKEWTLRLHGLPDADAGESWDEKTIVWDNAPLNEAASGKDLKSGAVALGTFKLKGTGKQGEVISFSSPELAAFLKADTNKLATIIITRDEPQTEQTANVSHAFEPKEQSKVPRPTLALTFKAAAQ